MERSDDKSMLILSPHGCFLTNYLMNRQIPNGRHKTLWNWLSVFSLTKYSMIKAKNWHWEEWLQENMTRKQSLYRQIFYMIQLVINFFPRFDGQSAYKSNIFACRPLPKPLFLLTVCTCDSYILAVQRPSSKRNAITIKITTKIILNHNTVESYKFAVHIDYTRRLYHPSCMIHLRFLGNRFSFR